MLIGNGKTYRKVAETLDISLPTVRTHISRIAKKHPSTMRPYAVLYNLFIRLHPDGPHVPFERTATQRKPPTGFIYVLQTTEFTKRIKVGFTNDVNKRFRTLARTSPVRLCLLASWPGTVEEEGQIHDRIASYRIQGEWFSVGALSDVEALMPMAVVFSDD